MAGWPTLLLVLPVALALAAPRCAGAEAPHAAASATGREMVVVNHAARPINELYVSPVTSGEWGADRLGDGTIAPGRSYRLRLDGGSGCTVDVQVIYDDATREERHGMDICADRQVVFDASAAIVPAGVGGVTHPVVIANDGDRPIQQVLISPADSGDWGDDLLGHDSLSAGDRAPLTYTGSCLADIRIVYDNRSAEERRGVDVCTLGGIAVRPGWTTADRLAPLPAPPASADPQASVTVAVTNHSGREAHRLFVYPEDSAARGPDLLGGNALADGGRISVIVLRPPGVCRFVAHVGFAAKGSGQDVRGIDLCRSAALVLPPNG